MHSPTWKRARMRRTAPDYGIPYDTTPTVRISSTGGAGLRLADAYFRLLTVLEALNCLGCPEASSRGEKCKGWNRGHRVPFGGQIPFPRDPSGSRLASGREPPPIDPAGNEYFVPCTIVRPARSSSALPLLNFYHTMYRKAIQIRGYGPHPHSLDPAM